MINNLEVKVAKAKDGKFYAQIAFCLDVDLGPSSTGKTTKVATSGGFQVIGMDSNNKPVRYSISVIK